MIVSTLLMLVSDNHCLKLMNAIIPRHVNFIHTSIILREKWYGYAKRKAKA